MNPAICPPEDVGGIPLVDKKTGQARYTQPLIIPPALMTEPKVWLIIDELDKADPANQVPLLTLLAERRIRNFELPAEWRITVAMNEPRGLMEEALVERLIFLTYAPEIHDIKPTLTKLKHLPLAFYRAQEVRFPERQVTRGALHYLDSWASHRDVWADDDVRMALVRGVLPPAAAAALLAEIDQIDSVVDPGRLMRKGSVIDVGKSLIRILCNATEQGEEVWNDTLKSWKERIDADQTGEWQRLLDTFGDPEDHTGRSAVGLDMDTVVVDKAQAWLDKRLKKAKAA